MTHDANDSVILVRFLADEAGTLALGGELVSCMTPGMTIWLKGDLGAGKTTLVRGLLRGLNFQGRVKSPTFSLVELYPFSSFNLYHFDLYRFADPEEWVDAGFREYFNNQSICLVEWPEKGEGFLPRADLLIKLSLVGEGRQVELIGVTEVGKSCIGQLAT